MIIYIKNVIIYVKNVVNLGMNQIIIVMNVYIIILFLMILMFLHKIVIKNANFIIYLMMIINIYALHPKYVLFNMIN